MSKALMADGTEMDWQRLRDLLSVADVGGAKPVDVSWSAWLEACQYVHTEAERHLLNLGYRLEALECEIAEQKSKVEILKRQYETAKASNDGC